MTEVGDEPRSVVPSRSILHVDMDAFFVAVELLDRPDLRGRPVIVGGSGRRGVVAAASYEARVFGVHSAMPSMRARRLCPDAVFLDGRHERYAEISGQVMGIFRSYTPLVEPISLDEAFLDVTGAQRLLGPAPAIAAEIRGRVHEELHITCSVGVAPVKFVAKLASEAAKPRVTPDGPVPGLGVKVVTADELRPFLHALPARALWGVGPATLSRLERLGVATVGDIAALPVNALTASLGSAAGRHLHALACGVDDRAVEPARRPKSVGHEETFAVDRHDRGALDGELVRLADGVGSRLRAQRLAGRTVTIKVRFHDFRTITRSVTLDAPVDTGHAVGAAARSLLDTVDPGSGVRLLGVSVSGLADQATRQLTLDDATEASRGGASGDEASRWSDASSAIDRIRARFGAAAIGPASAVEGSDLRVKRPGDQQWGPVGEPGREPEGSRRPEGRKPVDGKPEGASPRAGRAADPADPADEPDGEQGDDHYDDHGADQRNEHRPAS